MPSKWRKNKQSHNLENWLDLSPEQREELLISIKENASSDPQLQELISTESALSDYQQQYQTIIYSGRMPVYIVKQASQPFINWKTVSLISAMAVSVLVIMITLRWQPWQPLTEQPITGLQASNSRQLRQPVRPANLGSLITKHRLMMSNSLAQTSIAAYRPLKPKSFHFRLPRRPQRSQATSMNNS